MKSSTWMRVVNLLTLFAFVSSSFITPAQASALAQSPVAPAESALAKQFAPPPELGVIADAHVSNEKNAPLVIHIQDLHANYSVQSNIAKLLEFLDSKLGADNYKVAIEGAQGPLTVAQLGKIQDKNFKVKVCDALMKEAELTGTEYFSIVNGKTDVLWGVEDERYHKANIALFQKTYEGKQQIVKNLSKIENDLGPIKAKYYSRTLRKLDKKEADLAAGKISLTSYLRFLSHFAAKYGVDITRSYPEIAKRTGFAPSEKYPNIDKLLTEKQLLAAEVRQLLAKNDVQRNLAQVEKEIGLFKRFMSEQVTTQEVRRIAPKLSEIAGRAKVLLDSVHADYDQKNLSELVSAGLDYYVIALARDKFLTENALKLSTQNSALKTIVLVAGGFHTPGITKLLKEKGVSYITLTPNVTAQPDRERALYVARLMGRHTDPEQFIPTHAQMLSPELADSRTVDEVFRRTGLVTHGLTGHQAVAVATEVERKTPAFPVVADEKSTDMPLAGLSGRLLPRYTGSGNTTIHVALEDAKRAIKEKQFDKAVNLLLELIPDLRSAKDSGNIEPLMDKWNQRYPSELPVDLLEKDLPIAINQAWDLLVEAREGQTDKPAPNRNEMYRDVAHVAAFNLGQWQNPESVNNLSGTAVQAVQDYLQQEKERYLLGSGAAIVHDYVVTPNGDDIVIQINTKDRDTRDPAVDIIMLNAIDAGMKAARAAGHYQVTLSGDYFKMSSLERKTALNIRYVPAPYTERKTEPLAVVLTQNTAIGALNLFAYNMFLNPNKASFGPIEGGAYYFTVEKVDDIRAGKMNRPVFIAGSKPHNVKALEDFKGSLHLLRGTSQDLLSLRAEKVGNRDELISMISNPDKYVVTGVYAAAGRFFDVEKTRFLPVAQIGVDRVFHDGTWKMSNPFMVTFLQSGNPAVGEVTAPGLYTHLTTGGDQGGHFVAMIPVDLTTLAGRVPAPDLAYVSVYSYQSTQHGAAPQIKDIYAQNPLETETVKELDENRWLTHVRQYNQLGLQVEPTVVSRFAEGIAHKQRDVDTDRWHEIPDTKLASQIEALIRKLHILREMPDVKALDFMLSKKDELNEHGKKTGNQYWIASDLTGNDAFSQEVAKELLALKENLTPAGIDQLIEKLQIRHEDDPLLKNAFGWAQGTFRVNKADVGGDPGHTSSPPYTIPSFRATLREMQEKGLIHDWHSFKVGDDGHHVTVDGHELDSSILHELFYKSYFRAGWVAEVLGHSVYGQLQDLVGPTSEGKPTAQLADLSADYIRLLKEELNAEMGRDRKFREDFDTRYLPVAERSLAAIGALKTMKTKHGTHTPRLAKTMDAFDIAFKVWNETRQAQNLEPATVGNTTGEGPGGAEVNMEKGKPAKIIQIAGDKDGPASFNALFIYLMTEGLQRGAFEQWGGTIVEIWDIENHKRIFLDPSNPEDLARIKHYLGAVNKFNVKRLWAKEGFDMANPAASVRPLIIAAASTDKLSVITGGEYRGKDDATALFYEALGVVANEFIAKVGIYTQGDGRGSNNMYLVPLKIEHAIATGNSKGVVTSIHYEVDSNGKLLERRDLYDTEAWKLVAKRYIQINRDMWDIHQPFAPMLVGDDATEKSYPRFTTIKHIDENAPFRIDTKSDVQEVWDMTEPAAASLVSRETAISILIGAIALALGFLVGPVVGIVVGAFAPLSAIEARAGYNRNRARGMSPWQAFTSPGALETEDLSDIPAWLRPHEGGHQFFSSNEVVNFFMKHVILLPAIVARWLVARLHNGGNVRINARLYQALEKLGAASPIEFVVKAPSRAAAAVAQMTGMPEPALVDGRNTLVAQEAMSGAA